MPATRKYGADGDTRPVRQVEPRRVAQTRVKLDGSQMAANTANRIRAVARACNHSAIAAGAVNGDVWPQRVGGVWMSSKPTSPSMNPANPEPGHGPCRPRPCSSTSCADGSTRTHSSPHRDLMQETGRFSQIRRRLLCRRPRQATSHERQQSERERGPLCATELDSLDH